MEKIKELVSIAGRWVMEHKLLTGIPAGLLVAGHLPQTSWLVAGLFDLLKIFFVGK